MENSFNTIKKSFYIKGMTCATCAQHVKDAISKVEGVDVASVNLATETAFIISEVNISFDEIQKAVRNAGYEAVDRIVEKDTERDLKKSRIRLLIALLITIPLSALMLMHMAGVVIPGYLIMEILLGGIVIFYTGFPSIRSAWIALVHAHTNMDTLIFLGSTAAWVTAVLKFAGVNISSFGALGAMIVAIHLTGKYIEQRLKHKATKEIKALMQLKADEATVVKDGKEEILPLEQILPGDIVLIRPGERIPVDGILYSGETSVDESMISGESVPVFRKAGDQLTGGSMNLTSAVQVKVNRNYEDTFLSQMIALINESQGTKVPIQALADKITRYFVPVVVSVALVGALLWFFNFNSWYPAIDTIRGIFPWIPHVDNALSFSVFIFVSSIVIACPCALGLATPMALVSGMGMATKKGVLIRNSEVIQTINETDVIILDKTGTITEGKPKVVSHNLNKTLLNIVASAESKSNHPLAKAIAELGSGEKIEELLTEEIAGEGLKVKYDSEEIFIGKPLDNANQEYEQMRKQGKTVVEVRSNGKTEGWLALMDPVRKESIDQIRKLKKRGVEIVMATGDNHTTAQTVADLVGIDKVYSGLIPAQKVEIVNGFQAKGLKVLMAGDGINDAAALKGADMGISFSSGTDLAMDSSDIVIVRGGLAGIASTMDISEAMFKIIKQNLFWAFFYNLIAIPVAVMGWLHPAISELAMGISSITVVLNSLRIKTDKDKEVKDMISKIIVSDMNCPHCVATISKALVCAGIDDSEIDLETKTVVIKSEVQTDSAMKAIKEAGYSPEIG
ncbi:MAG TPA: heavy metal translocating P-type ATPase [Thermotogota bacterium]|nr:heavy metal translocating P-type ATPase [Thermotogota bacterium]HPR96111.1 heavy metal translocating P-type ATPase [Thermotogota bacterium]